MLYSEISGTFGVLKDLLSRVEELNRALSSHITENSPDRHNAKSIKVDAISGSSQISLKSFPESNLEDFLKNIIFSHINLNAQNISSLNNSHKANQIFYNPEGSSNINGTDVQSAIEELSNLEVISFSKTLLKICSNGILRKGKIFDSKSGDEGFAVFKSSGCNFEKGQSPYTTIYLNSPLSQEFGIEPMDILRISFGSDKRDEYFLVKSFSTSSGKIESVDVYGVPSSNSGAETVCSTFKNYYKSFNMSGFLPVQRPNVSTTNNSSLAIIDPSSATVIGEPFYFQNIDQGEVLSIEVDGVPYDIPLDYSSSSIQNIDAAIYSVNQYFADNHIPVVATKVRYDSCYAIVISHLIPNFSTDVKDRKNKNIIWNFKKARS